MQSLHHNLPVINGVDQLAGGDYAAQDVSAHVGDKLARLQLDIAAICAPEADVAHWTRIVSLERGSQPARVVLEDAYEFQKTPRNLALHLMISGTVDTSRVVVLRYASYVKTTALDV